MEGDLRNSETLGTFGEHVHCLSHTDQYPCIQFKYPSVLPSKSICM